MKKMEQLEEKITRVNDLANEVARKANNELSIAKRKITCLTTLVALLAILGACIAMYSIYNIKELFYNMKVEETVTEKTYDVEQNTDNGDGSNYYLNESDNNVVGK